MAEFQNIAEYFNEVKAISPETFLFELPANRVNKSLWGRIQNILEELDYKFPDVPKVKSTNPSDYLHGKLVEEFKSMSLGEINALYQAAHYLKISGMKRSIAAFLACKVYINTASSHELKKA